MPFGLVINQSERAKRHSSTQDTVITLGINSFLAYIGLYKIKWPWLESYYKHSSSISISSSNWDQARLVAFIFGFIFLALHLKDTLPLWHFANRSNSALTAAPVERSRAWKAASWRHMQHTCNKAPYWWSLSTLAMWNLNKQPKRLHVQHDGPNSISMSTAYMWASPVNEANLLVKTQQNYICHLFQHWICGLKCSNSQNVHWSIWGGKCLCVWNQTSLTSPKRHSL